MVIKNYSQQDTSILKGFAILCICFHNFFHYLAPSTGENEFIFSVNHVHNFFSQLSETPGNFINTIFSFLGHYGVQIFIFISGYGLAMSMLKNNKQWLSFVIDRLKKLYPLLLTAFIFFILYTVIMRERFPSTDDYKGMGYKLIFMHTLLPKQGTSVNGPWWFFGLIFQLYLIFPLLFNMMKKYKMKAFAAICVISYIWIFISQYKFQDIDVFLLQNFPGHLPEFCLGMLLALNKDLKINNIFFIVALTLFCLGNFYKIFFPFTFLSITVVFVFAYQCMKNIPIRKRRLKEFLIHMGNISMSLFAIHGFLRAPFIELAYKNLNTPLGHIYAALLFFLSAYLLSFAATQLYEFLLSLFNRIKLPNEENRVVRLTSRSLQMALLVFSCYILYHFVNQSYFTKKEQIAKTELISENLRVERDTEYATFAVVELDKRYKAFEIEGSMDIKNLNPKAKIPPIIVEVKGILWDKINVKGNYDDFGRFNFKYDYYAPFIRSLEDKDLKIYFWNTSKSNIAVENIDISVFAN